MSIGRNSIAERGVGVDLQLCFFFVPQGFGRDLVMRGRGTRRSTLRIAGMTCESERSRERKRTMVQGIKKKKPHPKSCAPFQRRAQQKRKFDRSRANVCRRVWLLCCTLPARVLMQQANRNEAEPGGFCEALLDLFLDTLRRRYGSGMQDRSAREARGLEFLGVTRDRDDTVVHSAASCPVSRWTAPRPI
jgi:hypothetical protein